MFFSFKFLSGRLLNRSFLPVTCQQRLRSFPGRRGRSRFGAREWRVFFDVAGGRPFGEFGRIVFVGVLHDFHAASWSCLRRTMGLLSPSTADRVILMSRMSALSG